MKLLNFCLFGVECYLGLLVVALFVSLQIGHLKLECDSFFGFKSDFDQRFVTFLLFGLKGHAMVTELLADGLVLLEHDLLILRQLAQLKLSLCRCVIEDFLEVNSSLLTFLEALLRRGSVFLYALEKKQLL